MAPERRLIGDQYDKETFHAGFRRAAYALVVESYASPDTPTGQTLQDMFVEAMEQRIAETPTVYYRMLEGLVHGEDIKAYAEGTAVDALAHGGDSRLAKMMMEIAMDPDEKKLSIREPEKAERYYTDHFPTTAVKRGASGEKRRRKLDLSGLGIRGKSGDKGGGKSPAPKDASKSDRARTKEIAVEKD